MPTLEKPLLNGHYQIIADINKGSYGVVSLAKDVNSNDDTGSLVAIKCIAKSPSTDVYEEALHEIDMHQRLGKHKNIAQLIDHFVDEDGKAYLVLEYCAPGDLYEAIKAGRGPREQNCILDFMLQLVDAVAYCHSRGVYHRDIKPENILIASDGSVKLADWGLASTHKMNQEFGIGSERYMAPELFDQANTKNYDAEKADIWAVGICLLNILFGRNPFTVASQKDKLFLDFAASREALFDIFPSLSTDVFSVLRHSLTMDPDNRSLSKLRKELQGVQMWTTDDYYEEEEEDVIEEYTVTGVAAPQPAPVLLPSTSTIEPASTPSPLYNETYEYETYDKNDYNKYDRNNKNNKNNFYNIDNNTENNNSNNSTTATRETFVTTVDRQPFRTPSVVQNLSPSKFDYEWNRTMQFTPPTHGKGMFPNSKVKTPSHLSSVLSAGGGIAVGIGSMEVLGEDESEEREGEGSDSSSNSGSVIDDGLDDDVFKMDGELSGTFNKLSIGTNHHHHQNHNRSHDNNVNNNERNGSGSDSSISSVPSLVQSTILEEPRQRFQFNGASSSFMPSKFSMTKASLNRGSGSLEATTSSTVTSGTNIPAITVNDGRAATGVSQVAFKKSSKDVPFLAASAPPARDFLKFGKSWSDIDFDDDDEEFEDEEDFYNHIRVAIPSGTGAVRSRVVPSQPSEKLVDNLTIKSLSGNNSRPAIEGPSNPNTRRSWVLSHWDDY